LDSRSPAASSTAAPPSEPCGGAGISSRISSPAASGRSRSRSAPAARLQHRICASTRRILAVSRNYQVSAPSGSTRTPSSTSSATAEVPSSASTPARPLPRPTSASSVDSVKDSVLFCLGLWLRSSVMTYRILAAGFCFFVFVSGAGAQGPALPKSPLVERVADTGFIQLQAPSFAQLDDRQKALAYWL